MANRLGRETETRFSPGPGNPPPGISPPPSLALRALVNPWNPALKYTRGGLLPDLKSSGWNPDLLKPSQIWFEESCWLSYFSVAYPPPCCSGQFLSSGGNCQARCVCVRARVLFSAHAHPSVASRSAIPWAFPAPRRPGSALPGRDGERGSPPSRQGVLRAVSASSKVGAEAGPGAGKLGSGGWTPNSRHWAAGTRPGRSARQDSPGGARRPRRGGAGRGAGLSQAASCPGIWRPERQLVPGQDSWFLLRWKQFLQVNLLEFSMESHSGLASWYI